MMAVTVGPTLTVTITRSLLRHARFASGQVGQLSCSLGGRLDLGPVRFPGLDVSALTGAPPPRGGAPAERSQAAVAADVPWAGRSGPASRRSATRRPARILARCSACWANVATVSVETAAVRRPAVRASASLAVARSRRRRSVSMGTPRAVCTEFTVLH